MKSSSSFKLKSEAKRIAATFTDKEKRSFYLKLAVESQLAEEHAKRQTLKFKDKE